MQTLSKFQSVINEAYSLTEPVLNEGVKSKINDYRNDLLSQLDKDKYLKIPFVGDFSSGKSTLINALIDKKEFLPTNIAPLTAISYELYFDTNERIELWKNGEVVETLSIDKINDIDAEKADYVTVYLNNEQVKQWNDRGVVIVDMPGIDSGLKAHNDAILNYIGEGTCFVVAVDAEQGTLRNSTIQFLKEIKQYNLNAVVAITKADKKPEADVLSIKELIEKQVDVFLKNAKVVITSSVDGNVKDLLTALENIDVDAVVKQKYQSSAELFVDTLVKDIQNESNILNIDTTELENKKKSLQEEYQKSLQNLADKKQGLQSVESSAQDVLYNVKTALEQEKRKFVDILYANRTDFTQFNTELISIIRPVIVKSIGEEAQQYVEGLEGSYADFEDNIQGIFEDKDNPINQFLSENRPILESQLGGIISKLLLGIKFLRGGHPVIAVISTLILSKIFDFLEGIIKNLFGVGEDAIKAKLETMFVGTIVPKIIEQLRPEVEKVISEQHQTIFSAVEQEIEKKKAKLDIQIQDAEQQQKVSQEQVSDKQSVYQGIINQLFEIKKSLA